MGLDALITGVANPGIRVRDLDASRVFYQKLGFRFGAGPVELAPAAILDQPTPTPTPTPTPKAT